MKERELFKQKMELEYSMFCRRFLKKSQKTILENIHRIDCMKYMCETAVMLSGNWTEETLQALLIFPGLLDYLYRCWIMRENVNSEMERCVSKAVRTLVTAYLENMEGEDVA